MAAALSFAELGVAAIILYFSWYKRLPSPDEDVEMAPIPDTI